MKKVYLLLFIIPFLACKDISDTHKSGVQPQSYSYVELKTPFFFERLVSNHRNDFHAVDTPHFEKIFSENKLHLSDSTNVKKFYTLKILHLLFTSKSASNGSKGEILNIPYFWHWITPNPRYEIQSLKTNQKLNKIQPPKEFSKYKSYADIDRTPYLFISELLSEKPLYHTTSNGNFSTFGWCSEREMAFVCLLNSMEYKGKVITNDNHSWSEFIISMKTENNQTSTFKVKIDNTFDGFEWSPITKNDISNWEKQSFQGQGNWYNLKALSETEKQKVQNLTVPISASNKIEESVVHYLKSK